MSSHEPEAGPAQQEAIRRLLAQARHDEPVPDDVARRLDAVLSQLGAEGPHAVDPPPPGPRPGDVDDLAARRRRRVTGLLGAAAAVVVLGVGATQLLDAGDDGSDAADSSAAESSEDLDAGSVDREGADGAGGGQSFESGDDDAAPTLPSREPPPPGTASPGREPASDVPAITERTFADAVVRLQGRGVAASGVVGSGDLTTAPLFVCDVADFGEGALVAVRYEGTDAVLAYRPVQGTTQVVDLLQCGSGDVLRSRVIPAR